MLCTFADGFKNPERRSVKTRPKNVDCKYTLAIFLSTLGKWYFSNYKQYFQKERSEELRCWDAPVILENKCLYDSYD